MCESSGERAFIAAEVSPSIPKPSCIAKRTPRRIRSGSSENRSAGFPTHRSVFFDISSAPPSGSIIAPLPFAANDDVGEAISALTALGYTAAEAQNAVRGAAEGDSVEDIIKKALKSLM